MEKQVKTKSMIALKPMMIFIIAVFTFIASIVVVFSGSQSSASAEESSDLRFSLINSGTEYTVSAANKNLTKAYIPDYYNGLPVTHIANNGFLSCTQLKEVQLPKTMQVIGSNAFMNCAELTSIDLLSTKTLGQNAFAMCPKLTLAVIPYSVVNMSASVFRNTDDCIENTIIVRGTEEQRKNWNGAWSSYFHGQIIYDPIKVVYKDVKEYDEETETEKIVGKIIVSGQHINNPDADLIIPEFYPDSEIPIIGVADSAFMLSTLNTIIFNSGNQIVNFESNAFLMSTVNEIIMPKYATFEDEASLAEDKDDIGTAINLFTQSKIQSVTLPVNLNTIYASMFDDCANLTEIKAYGEEGNTNILNDGQNRVDLPRVNRIGSQAFRLCTSINHIFVPDSVEKVGQNIFMGWENGQTLEFGHDVMPVDWKSIDWNGGDEKYYFQKVIVNFNANHTNISDYNESRIVDRKSTLNDIVDLTIPVSKDKNFNGKWYVDSECTKEFNANEEFTDDITLYAGWVVKVYSITVDGKACVTFELPNDLAHNGNIYQIPHGTELKFKVFADQAHNQSENEIIVKFNGREIEKEGDYYSESVVESGTLTVDSLPINQYKVIYDPAYDIFGTNSYEVTYKHGEILQYFMDKFERDGCRFYGWSDKYNDINGVKFRGEYSVRSNLHLYAIWSTTVTFDANGGYSIPTMNTHIGATIQLPTATKIGYWGVWNCGDYGASYYVESPAPTITAVWFEKILDSKDPQRGCYDSGNGRYEIWTINQFKDLRNVSSTQNKIYNLNIDVDLGNQLWTPFPRFYGTFIGNGHLISGIKIAGEGTGGWGLWSEVYISAKISGLSVKGNVNAKSTDGQGVGLLVGTNRGTISGCRSLRTNNAVSVSSSGAATGFDVIGRNNNSSTGGLIGYSVLGKVEFCYNHAYVFGNKYAGGIIGYSTGTQIEYCNNYGTIGVYSVDDYSYLIRVGGIVGWLNIDGGRGSILCCQEHNFAQIKYYNPTSNSRTLSPRMGSIAGMITNFNNSIYSGNIVNTYAVTDVGTLHTETWKGGSWDQAKYTKGEIGEKTT